MRIFVPSMGRSWVKGKCTATQISPTWRPSTFFVVPMDEVDKYKRWLGGITGYHPDTCVVGTEQRGIAKVRFFIGKLCEAAMQDTFCMMDDDLISWGVRESPESTKLLPQKPSDFDDMMAHMQNALRTHSHVSISTREGNQNTDVGPPPHAQLNTRTLRVLAYQTRAFLGVQHGRVDVMEDFDVNLQLLRTGHTNVALAYWTHDQRGTGAAGGCSLYRTHEVQDTSARKLQELHGERIVALRQKHNKTGGEFGHRTEVTIYWKKAAEQGVAHLAQEAERQARAARVPVKIAAVKQARDPVITQPKEKTRASGKVAAKSGEGKIGQARRGDGRGSKGSGKGGKTRVDSGGRKREPARTVRQSKRPDKRVR